MEDHGWLQLETFVAKVESPGAGPAGVSWQDWEPIVQAYLHLAQTNDLEGLVRLRLLLEPIYARDSVTGLPLLQQLDDAAIRAASALHLDSESGHFWGARGHNLHRQGFHRLAIDAFVRSAQYYAATRKDFPRLKSIFMTALCHRALGQNATAIRIINEVLAQLKEDDPWRGNPLQVLAWLQRDIGQLSTAESFLREAIELQHRTSDPDMLVAGTLADLGEIVSLQGRQDDAQRLFEESLMLVYKHHGQYNRQEARTKLKYAEHLMRCHKDVTAEHLLHEAEDSIRLHGHYYDLLWKIEANLARIYLRRLRLSKALRKLRSAWRFRQMLGLPNMTLLRTFARISGASAIHQFVGKAAERYRRFVA
jgi:tetratricopeptide (TPR) repeat protein